MENSLDNPAEPPPHDLPPSPEQPPQPETLPASESPAQRLEEVAVQLEAAIFAAGGPGSTPRLRRALELSPAQLEAVVEHINKTLTEQGRPYEIAAVAGGYQFRTRPEWSELIGQLQPERKLRLSPAAMDTLAVIAYRQPITRPEIEELRSVDCDGVLRSLMDRRMVRVVGRRDAPGRPALYGTTPYFLEAFSLRALHELPALGNVAAEVASEGTAIADTAIAAEAEQGGAAAPREAADPEGAQALDAAPEGESGSTPLAEA